MSGRVLSATSIKPISRQVAGDFLARFEILGNVGLGVWHWGLWHGTDLLSVLTFGTPCFGGQRGWIGSIAQSAGFRVFQLCRGGTIPGAPNGVPSRAISLATRAMRDVHGPFLAVAYADETLGEIGTIYQASGAIYTGRTRPKGQANYMINGRRMSAWQVRRKFGTRDRKRLAKIDPHLRVLSLTPKHRYVLVSSARLERKKVLARIRQHLEPYPKRTTPDWHRDFCYGYTAWTTTNVEKTLVLNPKSEHEVRANLPEAARAKAEPRR